MWCVGDGWWCCKEKKTCSCSWYHGCSRSRCWELYPWFLVGWGHTYGLERLIVLNMVWSWLLDCHPNTNHANWMRTVIVPSQTWLARLTTDIRRTSEGSIDLIHCGEEEKKNHKSADKQKEKMLLLWIDTTDLLTCRTMTSICCSSYCSQLLENLRNSLIGQLISISRTCSRAIIYPVQHRW